MTIGIVTFNRLPYLQKCIWSILASSGEKINVIDDCSNDGTREWLLEMKERGLVNKLFFNKEKKGTADNFNILIEDCEDDWLFMANDDMWFHRGWDKECLKISSRFDKCGIVSFYNYTRLNVDKGNVTIDSKAMKVARTGLGAILLYKPLWKDVGGFVLPKKKVMGYFASIFCSHVAASVCQRKEIYNTIPHYATHMDYRNCSLYEGDYIDNNGYRKLRQKEKGWSRIVKDGTSA